MWYSTEASDCCFREKLYTSVLVLNGQLLKTGSSEQCLKCPSIWHFSTQQDSFEMSGIKFANCDITRQPLPSPH